MIRALSLCIMFPASPALGDVPTRLEVAFVGWAADNGVSEGGRNGHQSA
jgi:hypothetical protein